MATVLWDHIHTLDGAGEKKKGGTSRIYAPFFVETKKHRSESNSNLIDLDKTQTVLNGRRNCFGFVKTSFVWKECTEACTWRVPYSHSQKKQRESAVCVDYSTDLFGKGREGVVVGWTAWELSFSWERRRHQGFVFGLGAGGEGLRVVEPNIQKQH